MITRKQRYTAADRLSNAQSHLMRTNTVSAVRDAIDILMEAERIVRNGFDVNLGEHLHLNTQFEIARQQAVAVRSAVRNTFAS